MVALLEVRVCVSYFRSNEIPLVDGMMSSTNAGNRIYTDLDSCNAGFPQQEASRYTHFNMGESSRSETAELLPHHNNRAILYLNQSCLI